MTPGSPCSSMIDYYFLGQGAMMDDLEVELVQLCLGTTVLNHSAVLGSMAETEVLQLNRDFTGHPQPLM